MPGERGNIVLLAEAALIELDSSAYQAEIDTIVSLSESADTVDTVDRIEDCITLALISHISEYSVTVESDCDLAILPKILLGLFTMTEYEDTDSLIKIISQGFEPEDTLAELLAVVVDGEMEDYLNNITLVSPSLIALIVTEINRITVDDVEPPVDDYAIAKKFIRLYKPVAFIALMAEGWKFGYDINLYLNKLIKVDNIIVKDTARDYAISVLASGMDINQGIDKSGDLLYEYFEDVHLLQQIVREIRTMLLEVTK